MIVCTFLWEGVHELQWGRAFSGTEMIVCTFLWEGVHELQWGRAFSGTEIDELLKLPSQKELLQWGRAFSGTEISTNTTCSISAATASMGPCLFRHGNVQVILSVSSVVPFASMGPCLFRHGNHYQKYYDTQGIVLQWGRAFSGTEMYCQR